MIYFKEREGNAISQNCNDITNSIERQMSIKQPFVPQFFPFIFYFKWTRQTLNRTIFLKIAQDKLISGNCKVKQELKVPGKLILKPSQVIISRFTPTHHCQDLLFELFPSALRHSFVSHTISFDFFQKFLSKLSTWQYPTSLDRQSLLLHRHNIQKTTTWVKTQQQSRNGLFASQERDEQSKMWKIEDYSF